MQGQVDDVRTYQPPAEAEVWFKEMLAHVDSSKCNEAISEMSALSTNEPQAGDNEPDEPHS